MVKMASNYQSLSSTCSTAPHEIYIYKFTDNIKTYKQKNWTKLLQKIDLWPISENKFICEKKDSMEH